MSRFILLFVVGVCLADSIIKETTFRQGREYKYEYEGQILTGIPGVSKQYSGLKLKCECLLQFQTSSTVMFQLKNIAIRHLNDKVLTPFPSEQLPIDVFTRFEQEEARFLVEQLSKPITFSYEQGMISNVHCSGDDEVWSINIKKGVLNVFQMNLDERKALQEPELMIWRNELPRTTSTESMYRVMEEGVDGLCESVYVIQPMVPTTSSADSMTPFMVMKTRDYTNCKKMPTLKVGTWDLGRKCDTCNETQKEVLRSGSTVKYVITGDRHKFCIKSAVLESQHMVTPYTENGGSVVTFINQTWILVEAEEIKTKIPTLGSLKQETENLKMSLPVLMELQSDYKEKQSSQNDIEDKKQRVGLMLNTIIEKPTWEKGLPVLVTDLVKLLRECTTTELLGIYDQYCKKQTKQSKVRNMLLDVLPSCGTPMCVDVMVTKIMSGEIEDTRSVQMLNFMAVHSFPMVKTVNKVVDLCTKLPTMKTAPFVKRACWLCAGSLMNTMVLKMQTIKKDCPQCDVTMITRDVQVAASTWGKVLVQQLTTVTKPEEKILMLKTIGNSGLLDCLPILETMIKDRSLETRVRVQAIYALRRMAFKLPHKIHSICLPICMNPVENHEIRIACYIITMETNPSAAILEMIARTLKHERSLQVASFIFTHMQSMANTTQPCSLGLARKCRFALHFARPYRLMWQFSRNIKFTTFSEAMKRSLDYDFNIIGDPKSAVPMAYIEKLSTHVMGYYFDTYEVGVRSEGLQQLVDKYSISENYMKLLVDLLTGKMPSGGLTSGLSSKKIHQEHEEINRKINFDTRLPDELKGHMYFKVFGNELQFVPIDKNSLNDLMNFVNLAQLVTDLEKGKPFDWKKSMVLMDSTILFPTTFGVPLYINMTATTIMSAQGTVRMETTTRDSRNLKQLKASVNGKLGKNVEVHYIMGVDCGVVKTGVAAKTIMRGQIPVSLSAMVDVDTKVMKMTMDTPDQEIKLVQMEIVPVTFVKYVKKLSCIEKEIMGLEVGKPVENVYTWGRRELGLELEMKQMFPNRTGKPFSPYHPLSGKIMYDFCVKPGQDKPTNFEMLVQLKTKTSKVSTSSQEQFSSQEQDQQSSSWSVSSFLPQMPNWMSSDEDQEQGQSKWSPSMESESPDTNMKTLEDIPDLSNDCLRQDLYVRVMSKGSGRERKGELLFVNQQTSDLRMRKVDMQFVCGKGEEPSSYLRSWYGSETQGSTSNGLKMKLQAILNTQCPRKDAPPSDWLDAKIVSDIKIIWETTKPKEVDIKAVCEKSPEQIKQLTTSKNWELCQQHTTDGKTFSLPCEMVKNELQSLRQIRLETKQPVELLMKQTLPVWMRTTMKKCYRYMMQTPMYSDVQVRVIDHEVERQNMMAIINVKQPDFRQIDMQIGMYPTETLKVFGIMSPLPVPVIKTVYSDISLSKMSERQHEFIWNKTPYARSSTRPQCMVSEGQIMTFDGKTIPTLPTTCEMVLTKDCSPQQKFIVTMQSHTKSGPLKKVKMMVSGQKIEFVPSSRRSPITIYVNGQIVHVPTGEEPFIVRKNMEDPSSPEVCKIIRQGDGIFCTCVCGLDVFTNCKDVKVKVSPVAFPGKTCGLCGNSNGELSDEFEGPDMTRHVNPESFLISYMIPSETCDVEEIKKEHGVMQTMFKGGESSCTPVLLNDYKRRHHRGDYQICFSVEPVPMCPEGCKRSVVTTKYIGYHCLPGGESFTQRLMDERKERVISELRNKHKDAYHEVEIAEKCTRE